MSDNNDDMPSDIENAAKEAISNLLSSKSKKMYKMAYKRYDNRCELKEVKITGRFQWRSYDTRLQQVSTEMEASISAFYQNKLETFSNKSSNVKY